MARAIKFTEGEFYHVYNRGTDKRDIFLDSSDLNRFLKGIQAFNTLDPIGSLYELSFKENQKGSNQIQLGSEASKLVEIVCYCLNPNHFHFLLRQVSENGISKFMQRLGTGFTKYFNEKNKRSGVLFQGSFKAKHVDKDEYLFHLSAYINLNFEVHDQWQNDESKRKLTRSSWEEYIGLSSDKICEKGIILDQFSDMADYQKFAMEALVDIKDRRKENKLLDGYLLE